MLILARNFQILAKIGLAQYCPEIFSHKLAYCSPSLYLVVNSTDMSVEFSHLLNNIPAKSVEFQLFISMLPLIFGGKFGKMLVDLLKMSKILVDFLSFF